jgi:threonyl-tRNA synthetase
MKILTIHADFIAFQAKKKAFKLAEEGVTKDPKRVEECLVIFTAAEKADEENEAFIRKRYLEEINKIATQVNTNTIVLYPYAHLSSKLSSPAFAERIMKDAEAELIKEGKNVTRAPFGWYKSFNISCKGHPLSELSRHIVVEDESKAEYKGIVGEEKKFEMSGTELSEVQRHQLSAAAILALAVKELYPNTEPANMDFHINEAYVDIANLKLKHEDLPKIEAKVKELIQENVEFKELDQPLGLNEFTQIIHDDLKENAKLFQIKNLTLTPTYKKAFLKNSNEIKAFRLTNLSSAYWKNSASNKQLTRITLAAFPSQEQLENYFVQKESAEARSHIKLGKELGLFVMSDLVGPGLPLLAPDGMILRKEIVNFLWSLHKNKGYKEVWTPHIAKDALYKTSGHWDKFGDELFKVKGKSDNFILKPMNCPHHMQIFESLSLSYRDMPVRFFEPATVYRDEKSGQLHGLTRVRSITQDDGHLFCRKDQIEEEVGVIVDIVRTFYKTMGMDKEYWVSLSIRGDDQSKYLGTSDVWDLAEKALEDAAIKYELPFKKIKGEAAFYGPKLDFMFNDSLGREWQLATIQCDFNLPERFKLFYMNKEGKKERPVVIHRAITGALERFMGILIENYAGKFPLWLSPKQVKIVTVTDRSVPFAKEVYSALIRHDVRVELDSRTETIGKKIRDAQMEKVNYIVTIGDKEDENKTLAIRTREGKVEFGVNVDEFVNRIVDEILNKV